MNLELQKKTVPCTKVVKKAVKMPSLLGNPDLILDDMIQDMKKTKKTSSKNGTPQHKKTTSLISNLYQDLY